MKFAIVIVVLVLAIGTQSHAIPWEDVPVASTPNSVAAINLQPVLGTISAMSSDGGVVHAEGDYEAKNQDAVQDAPLDSHAKSVASHNDEPTLRTIQGLVAPTVSYTTEGVVYTPVVAAEGALRTTQDRVVPAFVPNYSVIVSCTDQATNVDAGLDTIHGLVPPAPSVHLA